MVSLTDRKLDIIPEEKELSFDLDYMNLQSELEKSRRKMKRNRSADSCAAVLQRNIAHSQSLLQIEAMRNEKNLSEVQFDNNVRVKITENGDISLNF